MAQFSDLPSELVAHIFACTALKLDMLKACSLVCRAWTFIAFSYLFRSFTLTPARLDYILLLDSEPLWFPCVRKLAFLDRLTDAILHFTPTTLRRGGINMVKLINVQTLCVYRLHIDDHYQALTSYLADAFSSIPELVVAFATGVDVAQSIHLMCSFPNLRKLSLSMESNVTSVVSLGSLRLPASLRSLEMYTEEPLCSVLCRWLLSHQVPLPVEDLTVEKLNEPIVDLIHSFAGTLSKLSLKFWDPLPSAPSHRLTLASFLNLREFHFTAPVYESQPPYPSYILLTGIITSLASSAIIEEVSLVFSLMASGNPMDKINMNEIADWAAIDYMLILHYRSTLKTVKLQVLHFGSLDLNEALDKTMRSLLPNCSSLGVLHTRISDWNHDP